MKLLVGKDTPDLLKAEGDMNGEVASMEDIQPSPVPAKKLEVSAAATSPLASPKASPKVAAKPPPVPSNPLEAAMFKQLFPEQPKVVAKKSLAEMQAESGSKSTGVSPAMTRRESHTDGESGLFVLGITKALAW